ncbi:MAG: tetratricopeptide repeat protein [Planctomycetes bacterium]|nr:tetratricopeptide repeat protein [Planctomycetota bacterium]MBM4079472.1 tetratricopeptide repeat protein [Planctomycetota bacterium]
MLLSFAVFLAAPALLADDFADGAQLFQQGKFAEALQKLKTAIEADPANAKAYYYAALALEKKEDWAEALKHWEAFKALAEKAHEREFADTHIEHCKRMGRDAPKAGAAATPQATRPALPKVSAADFAKVEPEWTTVRTEHFIVETRNKALAQAVAQRAEYFHGLIVSTFLGGRAWPRVSTIRVYGDRQQYLKDTGMPHWSGGGFVYTVYSADNIVRRIDLYQLDDKGQFQPDLLTRVLPHEMTHLVLEEYFGSIRCPRWLNEGLAMFLQEGTEEEYADEMAPVVKKGHYIPLKDLFAMTEYPKAVGAFYAESESVTRMLVTSLTNEQMFTFLEELKKGMPVNIALQTATGLQGDLVEQLQKKWLQMMLKRAERAKRPGN